MTEVADDPTVGGLVSMPDFRPRWRRPILGAGIRRNRAIDELQGLASMGPGMPTTQASGSDRTRPVPSRTRQVHTCRIAGRSIGTRVGCRGRQRGEELLLLREVESNDGVERVEDPAGLASTLVVEAVPVCVGDDAVEEHGEMEDLAVCTAHRRQVVLAAEPSGDPRIDGGLVRALVRHHRALHAGSECAEGRELGDRSRAVEAVGHRADLVEHEAQPPVVAAELVGPQCRQGFAMPVGDRTAEDPEGAGDNAVTVRCACSN
jgi:hypothetical protein